MSGASIVRLPWDGLDRVILRAGAYEAWVSPAMGGNVLRLARMDLGAEALRTPPDAKTLRAAPAVYGMPLLFPPNRIHGGAFTFEGRAYRFPINEPSRGNFMHGFLMETPMSVERMTADDNAATLVLLYRATPDQPYSTFPHTFSIRLVLWLGADGLRQTVTVRNESAQNMPVGLGFHTAFAVTADNRVQVPVRREWLLERPAIRPNGRYAVDTSQQKALCSDGLSPLAAPVSSLYERAPGPATIRDPMRGFAVRYQVDDGFRFWMLWNEEARADHFCIEPMTWTVDAPNSPLPPAESGFESLAPGADKTLVSRLWIESLE